MLTDEQMAAVDDTAEFSRCQTGCKGNCNQGRKACEWTEVLPETCESKPRMGQVGGFERFLLQRRPTYTWAAFAALGVVCVVKACGGL